MPKGQRRLRHPADHDSGDKRFGYKANLSLLQTACDEYGYKAEMQSANRKDSY